MFVGYASNGTIWEAHRFADVYHAAISELRHDGVGAVIICRADGSKSCAIGRGFHKNFIWRGPEVDRYRVFLRVFFQRDKYGRYCWEKAGME